MYNLRYHIASLMAVFLGLALGLILGGLAVGGGMVDRQQTALVKGLQDEFTNLRDENRALSSENKLLASFSSDVVDNWAAGRLAGRTIIVVTREGLDAAVDSVRDPVRTAGGQVAVVTLVEPRLGLDSAQQESALASLTSGVADPLTAVAAALVAEWRSAGGARPITAALVDSGAIKVNGLPDAPGKLGMVLLAGQGGQADVAGAELLRAFGKDDPAVGAEMPSAKTGVASEASNAGAAGMDTLGTPVGDYTLISLLYQRSTGYYGTAIRAKDQYPEVTIP